MGPKEGYAKPGQARVSFQEAATVVGDDFAIAAPDPAHSTGERRFIQVGVSKRGRTLLVCYTERGERIRVISARALTPREAREYEEIQG